MTVLIDLEPFFAEDKIKAAFFTYKQSKTDRFDSKIVRVPTGADGVTWQEFEADLDRHAGNMRRQVLEGSYRFFALKQFAIDKTNGERIPPPATLNLSRNILDHPCSPNARILSIARIRDVIVQKQLYKALSEPSERIFARSRFLDQVSYAYRPTKSAPKAAAYMRKLIYGCGYRYVFEADVKKFFDRVDHKRLELLINTWLAEESLISRMLRKYLHTEVVPFDSYLPAQQFKNYHAIRCKPVMGIPQGGVLSGLLANLYLHDFDDWVVHELGGIHRIKYFRYADDFVLLAKDRNVAEALLQPVSVALSERLLEIHDDPKKTGVRSIDEDGLTFVGFRFGPTRVRPKRASVIRFRGRLSESISKELSYDGKFARPIDRLKFAVQKYINVRLVGPEPRNCDACGMPIDRYRNWLSFYGPVINDVRCLQQLDKWLRAEIYRHFRLVHECEFSRQHLREAGLLSLVGMYNRKAWLEPVCRCQKTTQIAD